MTPLIAYILIFAGLWTILCLSLAITSMRRARYIPEPFEDEELPMEGDCERPRQMAQRERFDDSGWELEPRRWGR